MNNKNKLEAKDVMDQNFAMMDGLSTVADAIKEIQEQQAKLLVIKKRNDHDEYGIVLFSDIAKKVIAKDKSPERVNLYEIMSKPVISVKPSMDVRYCARLFENFGLNKAPVIENEEIKGVISYENIVLKALV